MELLGTFDEQFSSLAPVIFYLIVGAIVFIETGLLFGFFLPGDSVLFSAGLVAAAHGDIDITLLVTIIFMAAFIGDQVGFVLGRKVGRPYLDKRKSPRVQRMIARSEAFYEKTGWWAVVAARFFPWIRTFVPPIAGISRMNYYRFLSANALGAFLWSRNYLIWLLRSNNPLGQNIFLRNWCFLYYCVNRFRDCELFTPPTITPI